MVSVARQKVGSTQILLALMVVELVPATSLAHTVLLVLQSELALQEVEASSTDTNERVAFEFFGTAIFDAALFWQTFELVKLVLVPQTRVPHTKLELVARAVVQSEVELQAMFDGQLVLKV